MTKQDKRCPDCGELHNRETTMYCSDCEERMNREDNDVMDSFDDSWADF